MAFWYDVVVGDVEERESVIDWWNDDQITSQQWINHEKTLG